MDGYERQPAGSQPVFNAPGIVVALVSAFLLVHAARESVADMTALRWISDFAFVPGRLTFAFDPEALLDKVQASLAGLSPVEAAAQRYFLGDGGLKPWTLLTYGFLHGNWPHVILNSMWLLVFGSAVARRFGAGRFVALMAAATVAGALAHYAMHPFDLTPIVGASAAVSGAMGAAVRFVFQPGAPLGPALAFGRAADSYVRPAPPLRIVLSDSRVLGFVGVWFVLNFAFGVNAVALGMSDAPIAWEAHVGGFLAGLLLFGLFDRRS